MITLEQTPAEREKTRREDSLIRQAAAPDHEIQVPTSDDFVLQHGFAVNGIMVNNMTQATSASIEAIFNGMNDETMFPLYHPTDLFDPQAGLAHNSFNTQVFSSSGSSMLLNDSEFLGVADHHSLCLQQHNPFSIDLVEDNVNISDYMINQSTIM